MQSLTVITDVHDEDEVVASVVVASVVDCSLDLVDE